MGDPGKEAGGGGLPPTRQSSHTQVRRLSHSSTRSTDSTLNIFPSWGLAAPPHLTRNRCRSVWGCVGGSGQLTWPLAHLLLGPGPPTTAPVLPAALAPSPPLPLLLLSLGTARPPRAPPATPAASRPRLQPPTPLLPRAPALAKAAADEPLRTIALRPARLPPTAARAPTPARCVSPRARARPWRRRRRVLLACPLALSRKLGSARAPMSALQIKKETASGCPGGVAGAVPGNNLYSQSPGIGEVSSAVERYAPPPPPSRRAAAGHAHSDSGSRERQAGLRRGRDCPRGWLRGGGGVADLDPGAPPSFRQPGAKPQSRPAPARNSGEGGRADVAGVSWFWVLGRGGEPAVPSWVAVSLDSLKSSAT